MQSSDNVACDILFDYIGGVNVVDEYIHSLGINAVSYTHLDVYKRQIIRELSLPLLLFCPCLSASFLSLIHIFN